MSRPTEYWRKKGRPKVMLVAVTVGSVDHETMSWQEAFKVAASTPSGLDSDIVIIVLVAS